MPEAKEPDPADVFTGKIQMSGLHDGLETGEKEDEDEVPFQEDLSLLRHRQDEDVFVSRDSRDIEEMDLFPDRERNFLRRFILKKRLLPQRRGIPKKSFVPKKRRRSASRRNPWIPGNRRPS